MAEGTDAMLYVLFGIPALFVGLYLLAMGPVGWFVAAFLGIAVMATKTWLGEDENGADAVRRTNCPECGAPNPVENEVCGHCEVPLEGGRVA